MEEWKECTLSNLGTIVGGATPSTKDSSNYENGSIAWITPKDLSTHTERFISHGERNITEKGLKSCSAQLMPQNSILFTSRAPIGYIAIAKNEVCTNQGFKSIVPNKDTDFMFLYYLLKYNKDNIENLGSGTTFKEVSGSTMKSVPVKVPPLPTQQKIADILSPLDDKIELNNKINTNLEQQAQALFKNWFVDFEPFGGKMPEEWKVGKLSDIADYLNGLAMQKFRPLEDEEGLPVLKIKELRQVCYDESSELCSPSKVKPEYIIHDGDVIFSWSGSLLVDIWCGGTCGLNQHLFKVTSQTYEKWFYYLWTKHHLDKFIFLAADKATTMGHIKREELDKAEVVIPDDKTYQNLTSVIKPFIDEIINNRIENRKLSQIRDGLLLKLMNGEIFI